MSSTKNKEGEFKHYIITNRKIEKDAKGQEHIDWDGRTEGSEQNFRFFRLRWFCNQRQTITSIWTQVQMRLNRFYIPPPLFL